MTEDFLEKLAPRPKEIQHELGFFTLADKGNLFAQSYKVLRFTESRLPRAWQRFIGKNKDKKDEPSIEFKKSRRYKGEAYKLIISQTSLLAEAGSEVGLFRAAATIRQILLLAKSGEKISCGTIEDEPQLSTRGVMLDVSRGRTYTLPTLFLLVDILADLKLNHLELYMETTFTYSGFETAWQNDSPYSKNDIIALDSYCRERFVELSANQNALGHFERWLMHPEYLKFAELPEGGAPLPWGGIQAEPAGLASTSNDVKTFISKLFSQLLPSFSSPRVNVGCDETFDLGLGKSKAENCGKGRLLLNYLLFLHKFLKNKNRKMLFWGDIILHYPELIAELPKDCTAINWGYEAGHNFDDTCEKFADANIDFWVAPGTSSWRSFGGRFDNMRQNILEAIQAALKYKASGILITDWGDAGHSQNLPISYPGIIFTAAVAWQYQNNKNSNIAENINRYIFLDRTENSGNALCRLGNIYKIAHAETGNASELFKQLFTEKAYENREFLYVAMTELDDIEDLLKNANPQCVDATLISKELTQTVNLLRFAINVLLERATQRQLNQVIATQEIIWSQRYFRARLEESLQKLSTAAKVKKSVLTMQHGG